MDATFQPKSYYNKNENIAASKKLNSFVSFLLKRVAKRNKIFKIQISLWKSCGNLQMFAFSHTSPFHLLPHKTLFHVSHEKEGKEEIKKAKNQEPSHPTRATNPVSFSIASPF
ncbi:hypothetical protein AVEN_3264-1 [Araneus ventricosus]|uniref:Uncharacterized protein n=1 Tax=Araneus ventricosus TaxID=182803 RepID=A0A4Y2FLJ8_ARAVE|nr:hypothetical protein AVEN_3264-1 [Araneus ventricosus]